MALTTHFTSGWPWPEDSFGLDPMYGPEGWCRSCGTPSRPQTGYLTMQGRKFPDADVWMPNWLFDVVCVSQDVARQLVDRFAVDLREVHQPRRGSTRSMQILPSVTTEGWYDPSQLAPTVVARHPADGGRTGSTCPTCGRWKWLPISEGEAAARRTALAAESDVIASPELFGDGTSSFRHLLFRRPLGAVLARADPRRWRVVDVPLLPE